MYGKGIDEILMRTNPGVNDGYPFYYAQDHEGSVTHLLDGRSNPATQTGNVLEKYAYDAFGGLTFMEHQAIMATLRRPIPSRRVWRS